MTRMVQRTSTYQPDTRRYDVAEGAANRYKQKVAELYVIFN